MKRILFILIFMIPLFTMAQTYDQLWRKVEEAAKRDLPQSQLTVIRQIARNAEEEKQYGQLLKAQLMLGAVETAISPDSLSIQINDMELRYARLTDPALKAVYATAIGKLYQRLPVTDDGQGKVKTSGMWFDRAMADPAFLATKKGSGYEPAMVKGDDDALFSDDLLHVIGLETQRYEALRQFYAGHGNRDAACYTAVLAMREKMNKIGMKSCCATIDSLLQVYNDLPVACELAILRLNTMDDNTPDEKVAFIQQALEKWGSWKRANSLRNSLNNLEQPSFTVSTGKTIALPGKPKTLHIQSIRNIGKLSLRLYRLNIGGDTHLDPTVNADYTKLKGCMESSPVASIERSYTGHKPWEILTDSIVLDGLPVGVYLMEATTDNKNITPRRSLLRVSDVFVLNQSLPDNKLRLAVVSATTGKPLPQAKIQLTTQYYNGKERAEKQILYTDKDGQTVYAYTKNAPDLVYAYTADDKAAPETNLNTYYNYWEASDQTQRIAVYTDRAIYRPGQTVHASAIAWDADPKTRASQVKMSQKLMFSLLDANYKTVAEKAATTDEFGTAAVDFTLPREGLTGAFCVHVKTTSNDRMGTATLQVEEYKQPTFQVVFDNYKEAYQAGDTISLRGVATTYSGVPVQNAKVDYTVVRCEGLRWFWWGRRNQKQVLDDSTTTADDGSFIVRVPMNYPENMKADGAVYYDFEVNAKVTDVAGETHEVETSLPLSNRKAMLSSSLKDKMLRDSLMSTSFAYKNLLGEEVDGIVKYRFDNGAWKEVKTNTMFVLTDRLASGRHRLEAVCGTDSLKKDIVVFTLKDKEPAVETHDWFYASAKQFPQNGAPVYIQTGASDKSVQMYYTIFSADKIIESGSKVINNNVYTRAFRYDSSWGNGITVTTAWVVGGKLCEHNVQISRPEPDTKLQMDWKTFRNKLVPGQKETWTLRIVSPAGKPAQAQLMATMFDKSLDALYPQAWSLNNAFSVVLPFSAWRGTFAANGYLSGSKYIRSLSCKALSFTHFDNSLFSWSSDPVFITGYGRGGKGRVLMSRAMVSMAAPMAADAEPLAKLESRGEGTAMNGVKTLDNNNGATGDQPLKAGLREKLDETTFFYPALFTDSAGCVNISFTLPESVTTWRFLGLAHDKQMNNALIDAEAVTSKSLMVQPNMPRFLREGDKGTISTRIFNTTDHTINGTARLQIVDQETEKVIAEQSKPFTLLANGTTSASFDVDASDLLRRVNGKTLLTARVLAEGDGFSDGEQHWLPILQDRESIITTIPFYQHQAGKKTIDLSKLFPTDSRDRKLTLEYTDNPTWLVIQAMPTLANPDNKDAASLAAAVYANIIGKKVLTASPLIAKTIAQWKQESGKDNSLTSQLQKNDELKTMLLDETPWVADADDETEHRHRLTDYLDGNQLDYRTTDCINKLQSLQNADGSFSWWPGMDGSTYMTMNVVETLVRLNKIVGQQDALGEMISKGFRFLNRRMADEVAELKKMEKKGIRTLVPSEVACHWLYASALSKQPLTADRSYLVNLLDKSATQLTIYGKAGTAVILAQYGKIRHAKEYIESIRQYSVYTEEAGRYFDTPHAMYSWCDYRIPSQTFAIEALHLVEPDDTLSIRQMQQWLLHEKRTTGWSNPINAVNAVYAFLMDGGIGRLAPTMNGEQEVTMAVDGKAISLPEATSGIGCVKTTMNGNDVHELTIRKSTTGTSWGAVYAQFTQKASHVKAVASGLTIKREITEAPTTLAVGKKVTVRITIIADRDYDFVQVQDKRASCLEPANALSGYRNGCYQNPKDNVTNYFFDHLRKGRHIVETIYYVDRMGDYTSGIATVQCAYAPAFCGREEGKAIEVKK